MEDNFMEFPNQVKTKLSWEEWPQNTQKRYKEFEF